VLATETREGDGRLAVALVVELLDAVHPVPADRIMDRLDDDAAVGVALRVRSDAWYLFRSLNDSEPRNKKTQC
jgi:hypothetical protein